MTEENTEARTDEQEALEAPNIVMTEIYEKVMRDYQVLVEKHHQHSFQFALNANHTAIRGCTTCGATWGTLVQGDPASLQWHAIRESEGIA